MHTREKLIKDGDRSYSKKDIAKFYKAQLNKFEKLGIGKSTENDTIITPSLIAVTRKRLHQIAPLVRDWDGKTERRKKEEESK